MRKAERIDIFLRYVDLEKLFIDIWKTYNKENAELRVSHVKSNKAAIIKYWKQNPDLRFSQVLVNLSIVHNYPGFWYYIEEDEILESLGIDPRMYLLWGSIFDKEGNLLDEPVNRVIAEMDTDHIQSILDGNWTRHPKYLNAFEEELKIRGVV